MASVNRTTIIAGMTALALAFSAIASTMALEDPGHGQEDLADQYPLALRGRPLEVITYSGADWIARWADDDVDGAIVADTEALLAALGKSIDDLTVGAALDRPTPTGDISTITALRVRDASAWDFATAALAILAPDIAEPRYRAFGIAGKGILWVNDAAMPGAYPVVVYPAGDTVWLVTATDNALLEEIIGALPSMLPALPSATPSVDLAKVFPLEPAGRRPSIRRVASGAGVIPALSPVPLWATIRAFGDDGVLGPPSPDDWMGTDTWIAAEAFLSTEARLDDLSVAYAIVNRPHTFLGAYQIAGADEAAMRAQLEVILMPAIARFFELSGHEFSDFAYETETVGDRELIRMWFEDLREASDMSPEHPLRFHLAGDTVWALFSRQESVVQDLIDQLPA